MRSRIVVCGLAALLLAGCASSARARTGPARVRSVSSTSPFTACVDPSPSGLHPVIGVAGEDFAGGRVTKPISLDGGGFRAVPPPSGAQPQVDAKTALCNLLAGTTSNNYSVFDAARLHGLSFGLGVVTVSDSILKTGPRTYLVASRQQTVSLVPYHARLAWLAVVRPDTVSSCPAMTSTTTPKATAPRTDYPGYQILAVDADTGAAGIVYSTWTNANCAGLPPRRPQVGPAVENVSVAWTLVSRGPGPKSASISYQPRSCDQPTEGTFAGTGKPVVLADRGQPGLVRVEVSRVLIACGPAAPVHILLRSATLATDLPTDLVHAAVGALDVSRW